MGGLCWGHLFVSFSGSGTARHLAAGNSVVTFDPPRQHPIGRLLITHLHMNYLLLLSCYIKYGLLTKSPKEAAKEVILV